MRCWTIRCRQFDHVPALPSRFLLRHQCVSDVHTVRLGLCQQPNGHTACTACNIGSFSSAGSVTCTLCAAGSFTATNASATCAACAAGSFTDQTGSSTCQLCDGGAFSNFINDTRPSCTPANPGFYAPAGSDKSLPCEPGAYQPAAGKSFCLLCDAGSFQSLPAQTACDSVLPGYFSLEGASSPTPCRAGSYNPLPSQSSCLMCPFGTFSTLPAQAAYPCTSCGAGTFGNGTGLSSINQCEACAAGSSSGTAGASLCPLCDPGKYQPSQGKFACFDCPANSFLTTTGATSQADCTPCPPQTPYSLPASTTPQACSPLPCAAGWFASSNASSTCDQPCPRGNFCLNSRSFPCLPGTFAPTLGSTSCTLCEPGKFSLVLGANDSSSCADCPAGTFGIYTGQAPTSCLSCPPGSANNRTGSSSAADCAACLPGSASSAAGSVSCPLCPIGTFQPEHGQAVCRSCRDSTYQSETGATDERSCVACPAGTVSPAGSGATSSCVALLCPEGRFGSDCSGVCPLGSFCSGASSAQLCRPGSYSDALGSSSCTLCPAGRHSTTSGASSGSACVACSPGTWGNSTGSSSCAMCPFGTASSATGSVSLDDCQACASLANRSAPANTDDICIGAVPLHVDSSDLMPLTRSLLQQQSSRPNYASAQIPVRGSSSLREAAFGPDPFLSRAASAAASASDPTAASISDVALVTCIAVLVVCATLPLLAYRRIPSGLARRLDQFALQRHVDDGSSPQKRPTKWGSAISWAFVPIAILVGVVLGSASNALVSKALLPASSSSREARGCIQVTLRAFGQAPADSPFICTAAQNASVPLPLASGFSAVPRVRSLLSSSSCSLAVDCGDCSLHGVGNWSIVLPWSYQLIEYEVWVAGAETGAASRLYGVLAPMASTQVLDRQAELHFSLLQSFYTDERRTASRAHTETSASDSGEIDPQRLYHSQSGFEVAYQFYQSVEAADSRRLSASSSSTLSFVFNPSDLVFATSVSDKASQTQLLFSILASVVSLFSLFAILFRLSERAMNKVGVSPVDAVDNSGTASWSKKKQSELDDSGSGSSAAPNGRAEHDHHFADLDASPLASIQLQEMGRSGAVAPAPSPAAAAAAGESFDSEPPMLAADETRSDDTVAAAL